MSIGKILKNVVKLLIKYRSAFRQGIFLTMKLSVVTVFFGMIFGSLIALLKMSEFRIGKVKPLEVIMNAYVAFMRGTPLLLQLYFFYFFLPKIIPISLDKYQCVLIGLVLNSAAYVAEIIRAGIAAVDPGQMEAARSLGLNYKQAMWKIIAPQAVKNILPALGNELVSMVKETSLASTFYIGEITSQANIVGGITYMQIETLMISGIFYFVITATLTKLIGIYEKRLKVSD